MQDLDSDCARFISVSPYVSCYAWCINLLYSRFGSAERKALFDRTAQPEWKSKILYVKHEYFVLFLLVKERRKVFLEERKKNTLEKHLCLLEEQSTFLVVLAWKFFHPIKTFVMVKAQVSCHRTLMPCPHVARGKYHSNFQEGILLGRQLPSLPIIFTLFSTWKEDWFMVLLRWEGTDWNLSG